MVGKDQIRVLGRPAFHDTTLTSSGELVYLGGQWRRDIAFAGLSTLRLLENTAFQIGEGGTVFLKEKGVELKCHLAQA